MSAELDQRPETFRSWPGTSSTCFPQLEGLRFSHAWGGAIDTCTRFCAFFGTAHAGGWPTRRLHRPRRRRDPVRRRGDARPAGRGGRPSGPGWRWCAASRCRSRRSRCAGPASSSPAGPWPAPTPRRPAQPVAAGAGPAGPGLRQLSALGGTRGPGCGPPQRPGRCGARRNRRVTRITGDRHRNPRNDPRPVRSPLGRQRRHAEEREGPAWQARGRGARWSGWCRWQRTRRSCRWEWERNPLGVTLLPAGRLWDVLILQR